MVRLLLLQQEQLHGSLSDGTITITAFVDEDDMSSNSATLVPLNNLLKLM